MSSLLTAAQQYYAVRNISWETTETWDIGLDANFLDSRLHFNFDFYKKKTKDILLALEIPKFIGYDNPFVNTGNMETTGYDIELGETKWGILVILFLLTFLTSCQRWVI